MRTKKSNQIFRALLLLNLIFLTFFFDSCSEDEDDKECNCGTIANDGITDDCYWLEIRSDCSQNKKQFCFDQDIWFDNHPGDHFCVTNETGW